MTSRICFSYVVHHEFQPSAVGPVRCSSQIGFICFLSFLGGAFQIWFIFIPIPAKMIQFDLCIVFKRVAKDFIILHEQVFAVYTE